MVSVGSLGIASFGCSHRFSNNAHPLVHPAALYVAARLAVALDDPCPLIMLGAAMHLTPLWTWLRVVTCRAFSELKASTTLRVNGVPSSQSSDSCATGPGSADVGCGVDETPHERDGATLSALAAGFTRVAALLALFVYGFTKTFHGQLGSLFDKVPTASVALAGATATTSASSTSFMGALNVSKVLSVASALLLVVVLLITRWVRAACIKLHHLEGDDRFINVGTGSADATQPVPTTAPSTSRSGSMSISTLFWLIGVSITGKVVDYRRAPTGPRSGCHSWGSACWAGKEAGQILHVRSDIAFKIGRHKCLPCDPRRRTWASGNDVPVLICKCGLDSVATGAA